MPGEKKTFKNKTIDSYIKIMKVSGLRFANKELFLVRFLAASALLGARRESKPDSQSGCKSSLRAYMTSSFVLVQITSALDFW